MQCIRHARIVTPDGVLEDHEVWIEDGRIVGIYPAELDQRFDSEIDAKGRWLLPGFIDIHADYIEHMCAPRPTSLMKHALALHEAERELVTHGITTMFHSLSLYGTSDFDNNPIRSPENTRRFVELIDASHKERHLIRHRFHARFEIDNIERIGELEDYIAGGLVHLVSFMDHTPGQGQYRDLEMFRKTLKAYRKISDAEVDGVIAERQGKEKLTIERLASTAGMARSKGIAVASHDDDTIAKIDLVQSLGATISEFPVTLEVAREARKRGLHTVLGAPNVLLGGSHSGNVSATEAMLDGSVSILCSDYYPASLLHAVFQLYLERDIPIHEVVRTVTLNPALATGLGTDLGSIEAGKKADLLVVDCLDDGFPYVHTAIVDGHVIFNSEYRT